MYTNMKIGADPEVFVRDTKTGAFMSAHTLLRGTKEAPYYVDQGQYQVDGVAAEFNVFATNLNKTCRTEFIGNVGRIFSQTECDVRARGGQHLKLEAVPTATFDPDYFKSLPEETRALGCTPDFNGYDGYPNKRPNGDVTFRTGSGHVHVGWAVHNPKKLPGGHRQQFHDLDDNDHFEECMLVARELDYYLGLPSLLWDGDSQRRQLYGKAGAFRPKNYGMEYRVLSNVWVGSDYLIGYVYDQTRLCMENLAKGVKLSADHPDFAREMIDGSIVDWHVRHEDILHRLQDAGINLPEIK